uniref:Uncharacterized protein n=1 Tax=Nelumbo nucifera TaxID=4432 RepID=A0A822YNR8_NELNU|nr:TPA_asm: hypothetical protein HUJ06_006474 [Nelumbo nucifera]
MTSFYLIPINGISWSSVGSSPPLKLLPFKKFLSASLHEVDDKIIWGITRNGKYSVKSGYHLARGLDQANQCPECSSK